MAHSHRYHLVLYREHIDRDMIEQTLQLHKAVKRWALCFHDKDENTKPHYHVLMDFQRSYDGGRIPGWFAQHPGIADSRLLEPIKSWTAMVQYLIHKNDPDKFQYPASDIVSSYDVAEDLVGTPSLVPDWFGKFDQVGLHQHYTWIHSNVPNVNRANKLARAIDEYYALHIKAMSGSEKNMKVVFIEGPPGIGKSTFARWFAKSRGLSYFQSGGNRDPFDGYAGQQVLILDDLRDSTFPLTDLLKILDNHGGALSPSRYKNKLITSKYILITTVTPLADWYKGPESKVSGENLVQLYRRVALYVRLTPGLGQWFDNIDRNGKPQDSITYEEVPFDVKDYIPKNEEPETDLIQETVDLIRKQQKLTP
jgi:hypothetical protein